MADYILNATPYSKKTFSLALSADFSRDSVDENNFWLCDLSYRFSLNISGVAKISLFVNGNFVDSDYRGGEIFCGKIFLDCYGYARLDLAIVLDSGALFHCHSEFLPVLVKDDSLNDSVKAMVKFIYENCAELLFDGDLKSRANAGIKKSRFQTLETRLKLAENIAAAYEKNCGYFKANCRFKTEKIPAFDDFEKLQTVTPAALQYIAAHPENLSQAKSAAGIRIGNRVFQPNKTLTPKNIHSRDTYENRAIVQFLRKIIDDLASLHEEYSRHKPPAPKSFDAEYKNSAQFLFYWSALIAEKISNLRDKFRRLLKSYSDAFQIQPPQKFSAPLPTPIFLSVPQYSQIFLCIHEWLKCGAYDFARENFMFALAKSWNLYEKYLLLKFIAHLNANGFALIKKFHINYPLPSSALYEQTGALNIFILEKNLAQVTIYYQPVICDAAQKIPDAPSLYRNNSMVWNGEIGGSYYVPDFVFKISDGENPAQFIIADAKFSSAKTVREIHLKNFILKYIFSISAVNPAEKIAGYRLVYAKCAGGDRIESAYDRENPRRKIAPNFKFVPLIENVQNIFGRLNTILTP